MNPRSPRGKDTTQRPHSENRPTLSEWLAVKLDVPTDLTPNSLKLEMRGRHSLTVHGCRRILDFTPCEVRLALKDACLIIEGKRLICTAYLAGAVGIEGCICSIRFCDGEESL